MASLWTPEGEHVVTGEQSAPGKSHGRSKASSPPDAHLDEGGRTAGPDDDALAEDLAEIERELRAAKVEDVIANHCYGLFQLAALYLGSQPPRLEDARLAIDALAAVVDTLGERLGGSADTLRDAVAQIRIAFVQIAGAASTANGAGTVAEENPKANTDGIAPEGTEAP
jgi:hypothetical protein